jgi:hypothetical protein
MARYAQDEPLVARERAHQRKLFYAPNGLAKHRLLCWFAAEGSVRRRRFTRG